MNPSNQNIINSLCNWTKYSAKLCNSCTAGCCTLPVELSASDLVRMNLADPFTIEEYPKKIAKQLKKDGIVEHYHHKSETYTLARLANGSCQFLDQNKNRCTIYSKRPETCRNHPQIGPKPGFCAYISSV